MKALLADDDEVILHLFARVAAICGFETMTATEGEAAWADFQREQPELVVLDWSMPGIDGLEVCRRIRSAAVGRQAFILVVTAHGEVEDLMAVLDAGADDYISKPVSAQQLHARFTIASRRIRVDDARRHAEMALIRSQRLAAIGETTLALQHEINNPLAALLGYTSLISQEICTAEEQRAYIPVIADEARRIAAVVKRLSSLREPRSVEYAEGARMIDLRTEQERRGRPGTPVPGEGPDAA